VQLGVLREKRFKYGDGTVQFGNRFCLGKSIVKMGNQTVKFGNSV
jgi:hypothetical protein